MIATTNKQVTITYSFSTADGRSLGSSEQSGPFQFVLGRGDIIPGLDRRLEGAKVGDSFHFEIPASEAYGEWQEDKEFRLDPSALASLGEAKPGMRVTTTMQGQPVELVITAITDQEVVLDGNHPLAGHDIVFDVRIEGVEDAPLEDDHGCGCGGTCGCS
ncbi:FKBP-type peptidyl-prolyl cis-trans isomerase [Spirochaeta lutea]|uniref:FKBP-type peptidyl-prolyl cis-trans isomerase n=1 Tax=Spirochaeta lutea TaxID=1480694 RepID=UPI00055D6D25|nr:peptidylprolyl isomerase [Spirochaeta lutea]